MGEINPNYPVVEVAIAVTNNKGGWLDSFEGDIIAVRDPHFVVGNKEMGNWLWLRLEGLEENEMFRLADGIMKEGDHGPTKDTVYDKRRYCIPLDRLKILRPELDLTKARDTDEKYQPILMSDYTTDQRKYYLTEEKPLMVQGLVFDRVRGDYL